MADGTPYIRALAVALGTVPSPTGRTAQGFPAEYVSLENPLTLTAEINVEVLAIVTGYRSVVDFSIANEKHLVRGYD